MAIHSHSIQPFHVLVMYVTRVWFISKETNYILYLPFVLGFEKKWRLEFLCSSLKEVDICMYTLSPLT